MTAYGRASLAVPLGHFTLELYTVNRRYLELNTSLPQEFMRFEAELKRWIASRVSRGLVTVRLSAQFEQTLPVTLRPNLAYARKLKEAWDEISAELSLPTERGFKLEMLKDVDQMIVHESNNEADKLVASVLEQLVEKALGQLMEMKESEGFAISEDVAARIKKIGEELEEIKTLAPETTKRLHARLKEKLEEYLPGASENEERILREICLYSDKVDINEEMTRLSSHLAQFADLLDAPNVSVGKTLEFLLQEMNREINTIGAKASELKITQRVIVIKNELERIREHIQNVE